MQTPFAKPRRPWLRSASVISVATRQCGAATCPASATIAPERIAPKATAQRQFAGYAPHDLAARGSPSELRVCAAKQQNPMAVTERHESRSQRRASVISVCQCRDSWKHRPEASIFRIGQDVASAQTRRFEPRVRQVDTAAARVSPDAEHDVAQLHGWPRNSLRHRANASCALGTSGASSTLSSRRRHKQYSKATSSRASGGMISGTSQKLRRLHLAMQRMSSASRRRWERALRLRRRRYATIDPRRRSAACAAASRATGTRAGAQET